MYSRYYVNFFFRLEIFILSLVCLQVDQYSQESLKRFYCKTSRTRARIFPESREWNTRGIETHASKQFFCKTARADLSLITRGSETHASRCLTREVRVIGVAKTPRFWIWTLNLKINLQWLLKMMSACTTPIPGDAHNEKVYFTNLCTRTKTSDDIFLPPPSLWRRRFAFRKGPFCTQNMNH